MENNDNFTRENPERTEGSKENNANRSILQDSINGSFQESFDDEQDGCQYGKEAEADCTQEENFCACEDDAHYGSYSELNKGMESEAFNSTQPSQAESAPKRKGGKHKKSITWRTLVACMLVMALVGCGVGVLVGSYGSKGGNSLVLSNPTATQSQPSPSDGILPSTKLVIDSSPNSLSTDSVKETAQNCMQSIVSIFISVTGSNGSVSTGSGSGVIITADGYIATNNHVVESANEITVYMQDGSVHAATLIGRDTRTDLAVIKIDATGLKAATLGKSSSLEIGDLVYAVGNPLGELASTVTRGIISGKDRVVEIDGVSMTLLQTDAAINPGNSGGGLFSAETGELIGIVNAKSFGLEIEGLGFAIPVDSAITILSELMDQGFVSGRPYMGISMQNVTVRTGNAFGSMFGSYSTAVQVKAVEENGPAAAAGIKTGDLILAIGDTSITSTEELSTLLNEYNSGDTVTIKLQRDGEVTEVSLTFGEVTSQN